MRGVSTLAERLHAEFPGSSGRSVKQWLAVGRVRLNAEVVRDPRLVVTPRDRVTLGPPTRTPARAAPLPLGLGIIHEDPQLLVIDKPPGLLTIATEHERERTAYRILWNLLAARRPPARPFIVHRLDRETSGLLVVAKTPAAKAALQSQFTERTVDRGYVAVVEGVMRKDSQTLTDRLEEDAAYRVRIAWGSRRGGREAITRYRVRERRADSTLIDIALGTGRRHQIRVQLAAIGHPVVGDARHGSRRDPLGRICLHATILGFVHPGSGAGVRFGSAVPAAFARVGRGV
jgi:23S rRNA pseudouridine1911/1915/1917 synthase